MRANILTNAISAVFFLFIFVTASLAQADQGRVAGTVVDEHGAVLAGATVSVRNEATGKTRTVVTDKVSGSDPKTLFPLQGASGTLTPPRAWMPSLSR